MKKIVLYLIGLILLSKCATAQKDTFDIKPKFGIGTALGLPLGTFDHTKSFAYEAGVLVEFPTTKSLKITGSLGYFSFKGKNGFTIDGGAIPLLIGVKVKLANYVYGHAQAGVSFVTVKDGGEAFTYSPSLGFQVSEHFDLSLKYLTATKNKITESYFGLRAGFTF